MKEVKPLADVILFKCCLLCGLSCLLDVCSELKYSYCQNLKDDCFSSLLLIKGLRTVIWDRSQQQVAEDPSIPWETKLDLVSVNASWLHDQSC